MYVSLMYRLWKILLSNMSRLETFGMNLVAMCRIKQVSLWPRFKHEGGNTFKRMHVLSLPSLCDKWLKLLN